MFKLYLLNGAEAFFEFYPITEHTVTLHGEPVGMYDLMGKDATLFQRIHGTQRRVIAARHLADIITRAIARAGITGTDGGPISVTPHDFRRAFATEAVCPPWTSAASTGSSAAVNPAPPTVPSISPGFAISATAVSNRKSPFSSSRLAGQPRSPAAASSTSVPGTRCPN